jgi:glycerophosphoryl diester phosphodiesterase
LPENSLQAFEKALELGVKTLEMDVVISKDGEVIVSHDPWISPDFCLGPENRSIEGDESDWPNIYQLTYGEILKYDCGSKGNAKFPNQSKQQAFKPRLVDVFKMAEKYCKDQRRNEVYYNIEIKSNPEWDGKYHPAYYDFSDIVYSTIDAYVPWRRVNIQSFDHRILQYFHKMYPDVTLAILEESEQDVERVIEILGFKPEIYSPHFKLLKPKKVKWLHDNGVKVIVWTVNTREDMGKMIAMGVDGIITDYPDLIEDLSRKQ